MATDENKGPWTDKPRLSLLAFLKDSGPNGLVFLGSLIRLLPDGCRVIEIESGRWDGYVVIIPDSLWKRINAHGGIQEE